MRSELICLIVFFLLVVTISKSQQPPCYPNDPYITYHAQKLMMFPPYSLDMPYDVLLGYVALDSLTHYGNKYESKKFLERQTFNDTLQKLMRYYYKMIDFNPIKYEQSDFYSDTTMHATLSNIEEQLYSAIKKNSPTSLLDYMLCRSHYILHIKATAINIVTDNNTKGMAREIREIKCQILDTIKGKKIPYIIENIQNRIKRDDGKILGTFNPILPDTFFVFQYSQYWGNLVDGQGLPWIKVDSEYVVFLNNVKYCQDSTGLYFNIRPVWPQSATFGMYPVRNGLVYDPLNEFGFGPGLNISGFKNAIRFRINQIISY